MKTIKSVARVLSGLVAVTLQAASPGLLAAPNPELPAAIYTDVPYDPAHPASGAGVQFESHGALINAQLYQPPGAGVHPTVVLLHGLPGNEQNLDLAQAMRRSGWTVITFHYRGSWGSGGRYSLANSVDDAKALLARLSRPENATPWGVDPSRIVLIGHSYGGYVAARVGSETPSLLGVALLAPWDVSFNQREWVLLPPPRRQTVGVAAFFDVDGRLADVNARAIFDEVMKEGAQLDLTRCAPHLIGQNVLVVTAIRDNEGDKATGFLSALREGHAAHLTVEMMETDHGFSDHRIALEAAVVRWLGTLGAGGADQRAR
jgi:pimeloyl-ACP methyl ester carboxylesterase